ncbi:MAG TPA: cupin domain-containing protein [Bryobacteraceae bacterium]|nr:cupin domain-containing protein [Bryobacteraceae bacterium]
MKTASVLILGFLGLLPVCAQQKGMIVWAPKPDTLPAYVAPHRPVTRLPEILAKHKGETDWREVVVDDDHLNGVYISMAPGGKTPRRLHADTREWWVVTDGQIRFSIEGQESFVASKGWLVQVPYRNSYSMETVGDKPSLRFEVNVAHAKYLYPSEDTPPKMPGFHWLSVNLPQAKGVYDHGNKPYLVFDDIAAGLEKQEKKSGGPRFVHDDRAVSNVIYGYTKDLPPLNPADKGHYHAECAEFWVILLGQVQYKIEGQPEIIANAGDIVYAPKMTWHRPRFYGDGPACRLAMNGYPDIGHNFEAKVETTQR